MKPEWLLISLIILYISFYLYINDKITEIWKPLSTILIIYPLIYILTNFNIYQKIMIISMGLLGYITAILYIDDYKILTYMLLLIILISNFIDITETNLKFKNIENINGYLVSKLIVFIIIFGFTFLTLFANLNFL